MTLSDTEPTVSVIVSVYNLADYVGAAIASLRAQSFRNFEALVVDDGSSDASPDRLREAIRGDARFHIITQTNQGLSGARNTGLERARGEFVTFLDGDDTYAPEFLETMVSLVRASGANWAACGLRLRHPAGSDTAHPAFHPGQNAPPDKMTTLDLRDARAVARLFPSAWNKIYRRDMIGTLRFEPGTWFEDHEFFWAYAARAGAMAYSPAPLYVHRRGRDGQITGTDSDRVFELFEVLHRLRPLVYCPAFSNGPEAFAYLATRLVHERALVVRNPERRRRFLDAARVFFGAQQIGFEPGADREISRGLKLVLDGVLPVSVVLLGGQADPADLQAALDSLSGQSLLEFDVTLVLLSEQTKQVTNPPFPCKVVSVQADGLAEVIAGLRGRYVCLVAPWERLLPDGLMHLVNAIEETRTVHAMGAFERQVGGYHDGWFDNRVLNLRVEDRAPGATQLDLSPEMVLRMFPALANHLWRRELLADKMRGLRLAPDISSIQMAHFQLGLPGEPMGYTRFPVMELGAFPAPDPGALNGTLLAPELGDSLPYGWWPVVWLRLLRLGKKPVRLRELARLGRRGWLLNPSAAAPDPETPRWIRLLCGQWRSG